jgi:hypothetical protein
MSIHGKHKLTEGHCVHEVRRLVEGHLDWTHALANVVLARILGTESVHLAQDGGATKTRELRERLELLFGYIIL